jgi:hypothetical protein
MPTKLIVIVEKKIKDQKRKKKLAMNNQSRTLLNLDEQ